MVGTLGIHEVNRLYPGFPTSKMRSPKVGAVINVQGELARDLRLGISLATWMLY